MNFLLNFKPITIEDREWAIPLLKASDFQGSEYSFTGNYIWGVQYNINVCRFQDRYMVYSGKHHPSFLFPAGSSDLTEAVEALLQYCRESDVPFRMHGICESAKAELENAFPGRFRFEEDRNNFDYIYTSESLISLSGKKLHGKRNHINQFKLNDWSFEQITPETREECLEMNAKWCAANGCSEDASKQKEVCAVRKAFRHYDVLGLVGGILRVDGEIVGYTLGEPLNSDTFVVHIEKAFSEVRGAYPTINNQFVSHCASNFTYVNREEDMGLEGLRKAKLSYQPEILLTKYTAVLM